MNIPAGYAVLKCLRAGDEVDIDGIIVKTVPGELKPSDDYISARGGAGGTLV